MPLRVSFKWAVLHQLNLKGFALTKQQSKANWEPSILFQDVGGVFLGLKNVDIIPKRILGLLQHPKEDWGLPEDRWRQTDQICGRDTKSVQISASSSCSLVCKHNLGRTLLQSIASTKPMRPTPIAIFKLIGKSITIGQLCRWP